MSELIVANSVSDLVASELVPVARAERVETVDVLRGLAVLGILLVNMGSFAGYHPPFDSMAWVDRATTVSIRFLAQGKFYPLFSLLFGWGMAIQMVRAQSRGVSFVPFFMRRMAALLLIGLVHAVLVWHGDILVVYALLGFPLILFRNASHRTLLIAFVICLAVPVLISLPGPGEAFRSAYSDLTAGARDAMMVGKRADVYLAGSYSEAVAQRVTWLRFNYASSLYWITPIFGMMLLGLSVGRRGILQSASEHLPLLRRVALIALVIGLPLNLLWVWASISSAVPGPWQDLAGRGARTVGGAALAIFLVAGVALLAQRDGGLEGFAGFAAVGRIALSNYLLQSFVFTLLFYGYGVGIYGEAGPFLTLLLTLGFFRIQVWLSTWWLKRYRFGPAEWLWRSLSYGRLQPFRR